MRRHSFATLITHDGEAPFATHVPVLLHADGGPHGTLVAHIAKANPQWLHFAVHPGSWCMESNAGEFEA